MGHLLQAECWERNPRGCSFGSIWLRKLEKEKEKALGRKNGIFGKFIYEK